LARLPRGEAAGAIHHAVAQGNGRRRIVVDSRDRVSFGRRYGRIVRELGWIVHSSCLMDTHHHGVIETPEPNLGVGMGRLQGGHARWLNERYATEGSVFRHRFWSRRIEDDGHFFRSCLYVVLNPVAAGLCAHPRDWPWCSYRGTAEGDADAFAPGEERLMSMFGDTVSEARRNYVAVVDGMAESIRMLRIADGTGLWRALAAADTLRGTKVPG
jgi:REP element-mobilizing transposase RayT